MANRPVSRNIPEVQPLPSRQPTGSRLLPWLIRIPLLGLTAILMLCFIGALYLALHQLQYDKMIYPGVSSYGADLSGMTKDQAIKALAARYTYGENAIFTFRDGDKSWQKSAKDLGVSFDPAQTAEQAFNIGRNSSLFGNLSAQSQAWIKGRAIDPIITFDQSRAGAILNQIGSEINQPVKDATILVKGAQVVTTAGQTGRQLDVSATLGLVREKVLNLNTGGEIPLVIHEAKPAIQDAEVVGAKIRVALSSPIQIYLEGATDKNNGPWQASPEFIAGMMAVIRKDDGNGTAHYELNVNFDPIRKNLLDGLATQLTVEPQSARFLFNEQTKQLENIKESVDGRALDVDATMTAIQKALFQPDNRRVALVFKQVVARVNTKSTAAQLGITESVVQATTFFSGSSLARQTNIQVAAARFHGLVIAPGELFSFNKYLGDVSPETGYETGLVIFGDKTIAGVGGGVCQVSTTVFQAAFFAGLPITERYAHGYRVGYYEHGNVTANGQKYSSGAGLDATVYGPIIDLKFVNDTPYYILMESYYEPSKQSLTFKFYSTSTGRSVTKDGPTFGNPVPHGKTKYSESGNMKPGQQQQVDYAVDGVDVHVFRTVIDKDGKVLTNHEDIFSHYLPWSAQFLVAPGYAPKS